MTNHRPTDLRTNASRGELTEEQLNKVSGGTHAIVSPRDASTGLATGRRQHKPFVLV